MAVLSCLVLAQAKHAKDASNPDEPIIHDYILTMDKVHQYADVSKKIEVAAKSDPALAAEMKKVEDMNGYNVEKAEAIEKYPKIAAFLKSNGMTARDFVFTPMTAFTAALAIAAEDAKKQPPAFINAANIKFVRDHKDELEKLNLFANDED
ncbi:MAG: hypothetical protein WBV36_02345 [Terriglobales bacterium]